MGFLSDRINGNSSNRQDGYSSNQANVVCEFQAAVEGGKLGIVNYDALRYVLGESRKASMTYSNMVTMYQTIA